MLRALLYAYVLGGITFIPLLIFAAIFITVYTSVPVTEVDSTGTTRKRVEADINPNEKTDMSATTTAADATNDLPRTRKGWLTVRRTFEETAGDGSYVTLVRSFLDSRSKDPKKSRPKDMWYIVIKGTVLYLYEDEDMSECEAAIELSRHQIVIYPEDLPDAELFAKRNAICLRPKSSTPARMPSVSRQMRSKQENVEDVLKASSVKGSQVEFLKEQLVELEKNKDAAREQAMDSATPWFIFVRSNVEMEDWYFALIHASEQPAQTPTLSPLRAIFDPIDMNHLVSTLDEQPDVIPMRWLNALLGRIFFSHYRTRSLESYIIGRFMKKLSKVKMPAFLTEVAVTEVSVGNWAPMFSKPMLKELTKEGDASIEVHLQYKGEIRITVEATAVINLGARFKSYTVKLVLAAVLKELEGNLLIKIKRPPSNRIWYAFTQTPRMVMEVEPIVSDRQLTWGMILSTIESKFKEIIQESVVMPNMDDIAFFDSGPYEHRGGIWSEACRKPRASSTSLVNQGESQSARTSIIGATTPARDSSTSTVKGDDVSVESAPAATAVPVEVSLSSSHPDDSPDSWRNTTRRRTWFSTIRNEDGASVSSPSISPDTFPGDKPEQEDPHLQDSNTLQDHLPVSPDVDSHSPLHDSMVTGEVEPPVLPYASSRRSVSQHSIKVQADSSDQESQNKSNPTTPRKNSDASQARSPSPPSFFHTLKAKTADKQAIKETAKEAMRKWGVNWGGFKKDTTGTTQPNDHTTGCSQPHHSQPDGGRTLTHKPRASYAEVRAAVAERKGRERASQFLDHGSELSVQLSPSSPEAIGMGLQNNTSLSPEALSTNPETPTNLGPAARILGPRKKSTPSVSHTEAEGHQDLHSPPPEEPIKPVPIHVQPVAKTMSIPGIHASHRGEVQSMGYIVPREPAAAPSGPMTETMLKNPTIQTVYRFLKSANPGDRNKQESLSAAQNNQHEDQLSTSSQSAVKEIAEDQIDTAVSALPSGMNTLLHPQPTLKSVPPPLPPRRSGMNLTPTQNESLANASQSSASEALKNIVEKDERSRTKPDPAMDVETNSSISILEEQQDDSQRADSGLTVIPPEDHSVDLQSVHDTMSRPSIGTLSSSMDPSTPPPLPSRRTQTLDVNTGR